jgi:DNA-binding CsgD family transcriptional regulator
MFSGRDWLRELADGTTVSQLATKAGYAERMIFRLLRDLNSRFGAGTRVQALILEPRVVTTTYVAEIFRLLNGGALVAGTILTIAGHGSLVSLGVALIVGGIFGFGAFLAQFWAALEERETHVTDQMTGRVEGLRDLYIECSELRGRIAALEARQNSELAEARSSGTETQPPP